MKIWMLLLRWKWLIICASVFGVEDLHAVDLVPPIVVRFNS